MTSSVSPSESSVSPGSAENAKMEDSLPKLSAEDFRAYNKLSVMMEFYHNRFRQTWRTLYSACENNARPKNLSLNQFITMGLNFCHHLTGHHDIEEYHIFPVLGERMPQFSHAKSSSNPEARLMVLQHEQIHAGLERLEKYLNDCKSGRLDLRLTGDGSLKEVMDSFGGVLWEHLDEEVRLLGAENMRMYWSKKDMQGFNW